MATIRRVRERRRTASGTYDIIYRETEDSLVILEDGTTLRDYIENIDDVIDCILEDHENHVDASMTDEDGVHGLRLNHDDYIGFEYYDYASEDWVSVKIDITAIVDPETGDNLLEIIDDLKDEISNIIGFEVKGPFLEVSDIPTPYKNGVIYLVGTSQPYEMHVKANDKLVQIGSTDIDLTDYAKIKDLQDHISTLISDDGGVHGLRYDFDNDTLSVLNQDTQKWKDIQMQSGFAGLFFMRVDEEGNLFAILPTEYEANLFRFDEKTGNLYYIQQIPA